jgi:Fe-S-cluster containining protein
MQTDKDKPSTWIKYKESNCRKCTGNCCTMPVEVKIEDLIHLGLVAPDEALDARKKLVNRLKRERLIQSYREVTQLFMIAQRPNGDCHFLHEKTRLCTVYDKRPGVCRLFPQNMGIRPGFCPVKIKE